MALKVKIHGLGIKDMLKFKNLPKFREKEISKAKANDISAEFIINENAAKLHPDNQKMVIAGIIRHPASEANTYILKKQDIFRAANFRAGQYLSVLLNIDGSVITRPYSISSSPAWTKEGKYAITVRSAKDGFAADWILKNWKIGDEVTVSDPQGNFFVDDLRDSKNIIALAGGSGITPFLSMAYAIRDKIEDFNLTILYGSKTEKSILFADELKMITEQTDKVKVVHVLSDEEAEGCEHGFLTASLIRKYAPEEEDYSVFICGPEAMYRFVEKEVAALGIPAKNVRREMLGVTKKVWELPGYPQQLKGKTFRLTVRVGENEYETDMSADEPILVAVEKAGIPAPSRCRSGECGWCRSKLVSGKIYAPAANEFRRYTDKEFGYIHPCSTFALSDCVIEVPGTYVK